MIEPRIRQKILNALTEFDRKASKRAGHNRYALGHYCKALQSVETDLAHGAPSLRIAILVNFNDRLLDAVLRAIGEPEFTPQERWTIRTWNVPELCDGCYQSPCICLPDDAPCDPN